MLIGIKCCKGCEEPIRHVGCHSTCEKYLEERRQLDEQNKKLTEINRNKQAYNDAKSFTIQNIRKRYKK